MIAFYSYQVLVPGIFIVELFSMMRPNKIIALCDNKQRRNMTRRYYVERVVFFNVKARPLENRFSDKLLGDFSYKGWYFGMCFCELEGKLIQVTEWGI